MMIYRKNLYAWEQWSRVVAGLALAAWAVWAALAAPWTILLVASGLGLALTGLVGFCPACHIAGRGPVAAPRDLADR